MATLLSELQLVLPKLLFGWIVLHTLGSILSFFGREYWVFDLLAQGRVQAGVLSLLLALMTLPLVGRRPRLVALAWFGVALNSVPILPYLPLGSASIDDSALRLRIMAFNVYSSNQRYQSVREYLLHNELDLVVLSEVTETWERELEPVSAVYPYRYFRARADNFGIAMLSRHPIVEMEEVLLGRAKVPTLISQIQFHTWSVTIVGTHPVPPLSASYAAMRNEQLGLLAERIKQLPRPVVLVGDLNAAPWSVHFQDLIEVAGLVDASRKQWLRPTWPSLSWIFRIPIDHILLGGELQPVRTWVGPQLGSDHLPILAEIALLERR